MIPLVSALFSVERFTCYITLSDFYNYFRHGIDFLISGATHTVRKIILHTNIVSPIATDTISKLNVAITNSLVHLCSTGTGGAHGRSRGYQKMMKMVGSLHSIAHFPHQLF